MKMIFFAAAVLLMMAAPSCRHEDPLLDKATITGYDPRDCMCCGGWFIDIQDSLWRFDQVPADCTIDFNTVTYPLSVRVEWKKKDTVCLGDEIRVSRMILDE